MGGAGFEVLLQVVGGAVCVCVCVLVRVFYLHFLSIIALLYIIAALMVWLSKFIPM